MVRSLTYTQWDKGLYGIATEYLCLFSKFERFRDLPISRKNLDQSKVYKNIIIVNASSRSFGPVLLRSLSRTNLDRVIISGL